jgi:hypothetical protein
MHSHNLILDVFLYSGPIIGFVFVLVVFFAVRRALTFCKTIESWIILAMIGAIFVHAMLEYPLHYAYFMFPVALLIGLLGFDDGQRRTIFGCSMSYPSIFNIPFVICAVIFLVAMFNDYKIVQKEHSRLGIELLGVFERELESEKTHEIVLLTQRREYIDFGRAKAIEEMSNEKIEWMKKVSHRFASPYYLSKYAKACQLNGRYDEAARVLKVIKRLFGEEMHLSSKLFIYEGVDEGD